MIWQMEPDAQAIVDAWLAALPGKRVIHTKRADEDRIVMEFCEHHPGYGWLVTTIEFLPEAWAFNAETRAEMLAVAFEESRAHFTQNQTPPNV